MIGEPGKFTCSISATSEPFMDEPDGAEVYYTALGRALILWGRFEFHLSQGLRLAADLPEATDLRPKILPISIKRQAALFRLLVRKIPCLSIIKKPTLQILPDVLHAAQDRHVLVHGHWNGFVSREPLACRFQMIKEMNTKIKFEQYDITLPMLGNLALMFDSLNTRLVPIIFALVSLYPNPKSSKSETPMA